MLLMPLSGWLLASASPVQDLLQMQNLVFGRLPLPDPFVPGSDRLEAAFHRVHTSAAVGPRPAPRPPRRRGAAPPVPSTATTSSPACSGAPDPARRIRADTTPSTNGSRAPSILLA